MRAPISPIIVTGLVLLGGAQPEEEIAPVSSTDAPPTLSFLTTLSAAQAEALLADEDAEEAPPPTTSDPQTDWPSRAPSWDPTPWPSRAPTPEPTRSPTRRVTNRPTKRDPTHAPTTRRPTFEPTRSPTNPTERPTLPTERPSRRPTPTPTPEPTPEPSPAVPPIETESQNDDASRGIIDDDSGTGPGSPGGTLGNLDGGGRRNQDSGSGNISIEIDLEVLVIVLGVGFLCACVLVCYCWKCRNNSDGNEDIEKGKGTAGTVKATPGHHAPSHRVPFQDEEREGSVDTAELLRTTGRYVPRASNATDSTWGGNTSEYYGNTPGEDEPLTTRLPNFNPSMSSIHGTRQFSKGSGQVSRMEGQKLGWKARNSQRAFSPSTGPTLKTIPPGDSTHDVEHILPSTPTTSDLGSGGPLAQLHRSPGALPKDDSTIDVPIGGYFKKRLEQVQRCHLDWVTNIAQGSFGIVDKMIWKREGKKERIVAVKWMNSEKMFCDEAQLANIPPHPRVVQFLGRIQERSPKKRFGILMPFYQRGNLKDLLYGKREINGERDLPAETKKQFMLDIAKGLAHLHRYNIIHRDIAARNILVNDRFQAIISDFGFCRTLALNGTTQETINKMGPVKWMAPEALKGKYSMKSDTYSFAMTCYEIAEQNAPFYNIPTQAAFQCIMHNDRPVFNRREENNQQLPGAQELIRQCWDQNPQKRPTVQACIPKIERIRLSHVYQAVNPVSGMRASDASDDIPGVYRARVWSINSESSDSHYADYVPRTMAEALEGSMTLRSSLNT